MTPNRSQHKVEKRLCPQCNQVKSFPARNQTCSPECASAFARNKSGEMMPINSETRDITNNRLTINLPQTNIRTLEQLIKACDVDVKEWQVDRFVVNKWEVGRKAKSIAMTYSDGVANGQVHDSGEIFVEQLYQVKATFIRKVEVISVQAELANLREEFKRTAPALKPIKRPKKQAGNMLELSIPDLHIGKLAWGKETGHGDYDVRIAESLFDQAVNTLIERTQAYKFDEICFVVGNDLLNSDNLDGNTTAGTPVTNDSRYQKTFKVARLMVTRAIERLREIAPVRVIVVSGNHDKLGAWHLGDSLECYFHKCPDVTVHNEPTARKYYQWGKVMLMWTHGDKAKANRLPLLMATEQPAIFGATAFREIHTGHLHKVHLEETNGVRVRILPSLSEADDWHSENGFVGNMRSAEAYVWSLTEGLIGTAVFTAPVYSAN